MKCIFITVRTGSTRLPNKSIMDLCGKPTVEWLIENIKRSENANEIVLCTTCLGEDDVLCNLAIKNGIQYFRGSKDDKLSRWLGACEEFDIDFFANVDGDDLFFDYHIADDVIAQHDISNADFIDGQGFMYNDVCGISRSALKEVCIAKGDYDVEYIKPYFHSFDTQKFVSQEKWNKGNVRMTLDYLDDFNFFEAVIKGMGEKELSFDNILEYLKENPRIASLNYWLEDEWKRNQNDEITKQEMGGL